VSTNFKVTEAFVELGIPTFYLAENQETKQAFLRLLASLDLLNLLPVLRRINKRIVLRVISKPKVKRSNTLVNWILLLATVATTFYSGFLISPEGINPYLGGAAFVAAILAVLGTHEMGHWITARRKRMEATLPYFIPSFPPIGTFGAVIMQKSLAPNRDSLFDVGSRGPLVGFVVSVFVSLIGLTLSVPSLPPENAINIGVPFIWYGLERFLLFFTLLPAVPSGMVPLLHPIAFAGWLGLFVTMLNLLPAGMLDGGHVVRSTIGEKLRWILSGLSFVFLIYEELWVMAGLVLLLSFFRHPGPLDDVSELSTGRKVLAFVIIGIFFLCASPTVPIIS